MQSKRAKLAQLHQEMEACLSCPKMAGPVVHGPPVPSRILLVGQAPGPREGSLGRPFAWTAGRTLFRWFEEGLGVDEESFRARVYISAVARCFPGKAKGGGDRKPDPAEILRCRPYLDKEVQILRPELVIPVGTLAIREVTLEDRPLVEVVGRQERLRYHGVELDSIALPHPSGASTWHQRDPGKTLLHQALALISRHPAVKATFPELR